MRAGGIGDLGHSGPEGEKGMACCCLFVLLATAPADGREARLVREGERRERATVVFVHGAGGTPAQFAELAGRLRGRVNIAAFAYDDHERLAASAEVLGRELARLRGEVVVIAHSMGTLLVAYLGATDTAGRWRCLAVVYLNPLVGGTHYADDIPALWWLRPLKPFIQRTFFRPSIRDLAPENEFQQRVFGRESAPASFREHTLVVLTEPAGKELDIKPERAPQFFGRTREELLARMGTVIRPRGVVGHNAPLHTPEVVVPLIEDFLAAPPCAAS